MFKKISLQFTEEMHGFVKISQDLNQSTENYLLLERKGQEANSYLKFHLTIEIDDIDSFLNDPQLVARATGFIDSKEFGTKLEVTEGIFNLFVRSEQSDNFDAIKEMHYLLKFFDNNKKAYTFFGYKVILKDELSDAWNETTTLYTSIYEGHGDIKNGKLHSRGILRLNLEDFTTQMGTLVTSGGSFLENQNAKFKFFEAFAANLWTAYAPFTLFKSEQYNADHYIYPLETTIGVKNAKVEYYKVNTEDGLALTLDRFIRAENKNVVVLVHGLTNSTDMFTMPEHYNLVNYLNDNGFTDVISLNWRGSNRFVYNLAPHNYSIDDIVFYDMPAAFKKIKEIVGADKKIHVIGHCVGSMTVAGAISAGLLPEVNSFISNSVSFTPQIFLFSKIKLFLAPYFFETLLRLPYVSPKIPYIKRRWLRGFNLILEFWRHFITRECKEPACHYISFLWGTGAPAFFNHKNLHYLTHRRLKDLFGGTSFNFHRHIIKLVNKKEFIKTSKSEVYAKLPESYLHAAIKNKMPPILFVSGEINKIFPDSNKVSFDILKSHQLDVEYFPVKDYGHQDIFIGQKVHKDIFPTFLKFLNKHAN